jgi:uncharacterized delta-60 repeat protein
LAGRINIVKVFMQKLQKKNFVPGWRLLLPLGVLAWIGLAASSSMAQTFASPIVLDTTSTWGATNFDNTGATPSPGSPPIAGFAEVNPIWFQWTAPQPGEVTLDTLGSVDDVFGLPLDTVLGVFAGTNLTTLNQVAANDDLYWINNNNPQPNESGSGDYALAVGPGGEAVYGYDQNYYGPSGLRFNAEANTTYYIAVDTKVKTGPGLISLNWAYQPSGVFGFATEDRDFWSQMPLYQCAETESDEPGGPTIQGNSVITTYYTYNAEGLLVTVTRFAGSYGRASVDYYTTDGTNLPVTFTPDLPAVQGTDYVPVSGTLIFDDFEMSKTILVPIIDAGIGGSGGYTNNTYFGLVLTNAQADPLEPSISAPRIDTRSGMAMVKILNPNADPYGPDTVTTNVVTCDTNNPPNCITNIVTYIVPPTNAVVNFEKSCYRVPADVNNPATGNSWAQVTLYVARYGTNNSAITLNYRINNFLNYDKDNGEEMNDYFPLQPGSDYAVPTPPSWSPVRGVNSDFDMIQGTISFPSGNGAFTSQPITFTVPITNLTKFNRDFHVELYTERSLNNVTLPWLAGMVAETTVTILFDDQNPPAGSVDELYNADFNSEMALPPADIPPSWPVDMIENPGVSGEVYSLAVLPNNETIIAGDFSSYNGAAIGQDCIALVDTNGALDASFNPGTGANHAIYAVAVSGDQFVVGGAFTAINNFEHSYIARLNSDGSLDGSFNPFTDQPVRAVALQQDGRILIGGDFTLVNGQPCSCVARLNADGSLDTTFNTNNILSGSVSALALAPADVYTVVRNNNGTNEDDLPINTGLLTSGQLTVSYNFYYLTNIMQVFYGDTNVTAGTGVQIYAVTNPGTGSFAIPFGPTNGSTGLITTNLLTIVMNQGGATNSGMKWTYQASIGVPQNTGIAVGGQFTVAGKSYANIAMLHTDGSLNTSFNPGTGTDNKVQALSWQISNQILAGGTFTNVNGLSYNSIVRFNINGSIDTNFFMGTGANGPVFTITSQLDGSSYVGGLFSSFNGTHRLGFTRLYFNGTVDTTFLDTSYNQFAGLKRIYSWDKPGVFASGVQSDGKVMIGGSFNQVGGGQADPNVCNSLDGELGYAQSFADPNLWVEPKSRDGVRNRSSIARLIGGSTPGPGNIGMVLNGYSANKNQSDILVSLVRTNGFLGPVSANFSVLPGEAQSGLNYVYYGTPPMYWISWEYLWDPSRVRSGGIYGNNGAMVDAYGLPLTAAVQDKEIKNLAQVTVSVINNSTPGNLDAKFQLANPSCADQFFLGGENIPIGGALGTSLSSFTVIDNTEKPGTFSFSSPVFIATNASVPISVLRSNGTYGVVSMWAYTSNGTAVAGTDYAGYTNTDFLFNNVVSNGFNITVYNHGLIYTNQVEKTVNLLLSHLGTTPGATFGISNAVLRLINPNYVGYVTFSASNYYGAESSGAISLTVSRVGGSLGTISVGCMTTNGVPPNAATNGVDFYGVTNWLIWNNGDVTPRTVTVALTNSGVVGPNKHFNAFLFNPTNGVLPAPSLMGAISNATLTISNDNSYGTVQFSAPAYTVNEAGGSATLTVLRTGGVAGPASVSYQTSPGSNTVPGVNYSNTVSTLIFTNNQIAASFIVPVINQLSTETSNFFFNVMLYNPNPTNLALGSLTNAVVNILAANGWNQPPGTADSGFNPATTMNGSVFALALQSAGQVMVGGNFTVVGTTPEGYLARLNTDSSLDTTFLNGMAGANGPVLAVVSQTTGNDGELDRVLVGGSFTAVNNISRRSIARLMTDGSVDTSFNPGAGADNTVNALAESFIGGLREIYVGGAFNIISGGPSPGIARLNNDGSLDTTFAVGAGADGPVYAVAAYPTNSSYAGMVLIGGAFTNFNGNPLNNLARLNANGSVDTNFEANVGLGPNDAVRAIAIQLDGSVLVGGSFTNFNGTAVNRIVRLNSNGSMDTGFLSNLGPGANSTVEGIALQPDNRIVLVGQFSQVNGVTRNHVTRLLPNGLPDPTINFGDGANGDVDATLFLPSTGMLVLGGTFSLYDDQPYQNIVWIYGESATGSGAFQFTTANYYADETNVYGAITIRRTGGTSGPTNDPSGNVFVTFATYDGSAIAGSNYTTVLENVGFPPGEVLETVEVPVINALVLTSNLTVNLVISNATPPAIISSIQPVATLWILNDYSDVIFTNAYPTVRKDDPTGVASIGILRQGSVSTASSVDYYTTTNGSAIIGTDYYPTNGTITFNPGQSNAVIQIPIINNSLAEGNKTVTMLLTNAVNTLLYAPSNATLTIIDTVSLPGQISFAATNFVVNQTDGTAVLTLVRTNGYSASPTVNWVTVPGTARPGIDYTTVTNGQANFENGTASTTITVQLKDSGQAQPTVNFSVVLSNPTEGATLTAPSTATVSILCDNSGFAFAAPTNTVMETATNVLVNVLRLGPTNGTGQVNYATQDGTAVAGVNYYTTDSTTNGPLIFPPGITSRGIVVGLIDDPKVTGNLTFNIVLSDPSSGYSLGTPFTNTVVVEDADAGLSFSTNAATVLSTAGAALITVITTNTIVEPVIVNTSTVPLSVQYATSDGTAISNQDYRAVSGTLVFTNGNGTNTFVVPILFSGQVRGDRTFNVTLSNPTPPGQLISPSNEVVTIHDGVSGFSFSSPAYTVLKSVQAAAINIYRTGNTNIVASVDYNATNGTAVPGLHYYPTNGTLIFTNGVTNLSFSVGVIDTTTVQPDETVLLQLFSPVSGVLMPPTAATLTIHDNSGSFVVPAGSTLVYESGPTNGIIDTNETVTMLFAFRDAGGNGVTNLIATLLATNGVTSPSPASQTYGPLAYNGHSVSRPFTFTAHGTNGQQIVATFQLSDNSKSIGTAVFGYTLGTWVNVYSNTALITINDATSSSPSPASPYPSSITLSNLVGSIYKTTITLTNLNHTSPHDIDALLVAPNQLDTLFMAHCGGQNAINNITLTFDDAASNSLPNLTPLTSGTNKPSGYMPVPNFP